MTIQTCVHTNIQRQIHQEQADCGCLEEGEKGKRSLGGCGVPFEGNENLLEPDAHVTDWSFSNLSPHGFPGCSSYRPPQSSSQPLKPLDLFSVLKASSPTSSTHKRNPQKATQKVLQVLCTQCSPPGHECCYLQAKLPLPRLLAGHPHIIQDSPGHPSSLSNPHFSSGPAATSSLAVRGWLPSPSDSAIFVVLSHQPWHSYFRILLLDKLGQTVAGSNHPKTR